VKIIIFYGLWHPRALWIRLGTFFTVFFQGVNGGLWRLCFHLACSYQVESRLRFHGVLLTDWDKYACWTIGVF
jgi:hypothetical protein